MTGASKRPRYISPRWYAGWFAFSTAGFFVAATVVHFGSPTAILQDQTEYWLPLALCMDPVFLLSQVVLFLMWQRRVILNLRALGVSGQRSWSGWYTLFWFVPVFNLFVPYQAIQELWRASDASREALDGISWKDKKGSTLVVLWWSLWVLATVIYLIDHALLQNPNSGGYPPGSPFTDLVMWAIYAALYIADAALIVTIVIQITRRQDAKYARLRAQAENVPPA